MSVRQCKPHKIILKFLFIIEAKLGNRGKEFNAKKLIFMLSDFLSFFGGGGLLFHKNNIFFHENKLFHAEWQNFKGNDKIF